MAEKTTAFTGPVVVGLNDKKGEIRLTDGKNVNEAKYLAIAAPDNITSDTTLTFPNGAGTAGQILSTDGAGGLSWVNDSAGNPDGTNGQVQVNDNGSFGAISEGSSGQILTSNGAGSAPTFQAAPAGGIAAVVDDTTPELGGDLASNGFDINFADNDEAKFGDGTDLRIYHDSVSNHSFIKESGGGSLIMNTNNLVVQNAAGTANIINAPEGAAGVDLYYNGNIKLSTNNTGIQTTGSVNVNGAYSLPTSDGTANQVLKTDGAGNVTFQTASGADPITSSLDIPDTKTVRIDANHPDGTGNVAMGRLALDNVTGLYNTAIGNTAGQQITSGTANVAIGHSSLISNQSGQYNVAIGGNSLNSNTASENVGVGLRTLSQNTTGAQNTAIGTRAMDLNSGGTQNVAIGYKALYVGGGQQQNVAVGWQALKDCSAGFQNTAVGDDAMNLTVNGWGNTAMGDGALQQVDGNANTGIGQSVGGSLTSGGNNVLIGRSAGNTLTTGSDNVILGTNSTPSSATVSDEVTLGNSSVATLRCNVTSITALSDARDKKDVEDANIGLDFINDLRPVKFVWDTRDGAKKDIKEVGFIAQELDEVQQKHGVEDHLQLVLKNNPDKLEASQGKLIPILVQAIKDLKKEIDELKKA